MSGCEKRAVLLSQQVRWIYQNFDCTKGNLTDAIKILSLIQIIFVCTIIICVIWSSILNDKFKRHIWTFICFCNIWIQKFVANIRVFFFYLTIKVNVRTVAIRENPCHVFRRALGRLTEFIKGTELIHLIQNCALNRSIKN